MSITSSFYDGLNKLAIGFLLCIPVVSYFSCCAINQTSFFILCWLTGIFFWAIFEIKLHQINQSFSFLKKNNLEWINNEYNSVTKVVGRKYIRKGTSTQLDNLELNDYYTIYYIVQKKGLLGPIPVLESYSAFFLNLPIVIIWWIIAISTGIWQYYHFTSIPVYVIVLVLFILIILSLSILKSIEHKIFNTILYSYFLGI